MSNQQSNNGIGVLGLLGVVFITLKLVGVIGWSWWWVTMPFWGGFALFIAAVIIYAFISVVGAAIKRSRNAKGLRARE